MSAVQDAVIRYCMDRADKFAAYRTYTWRTDQTAPGVQGRATVAEATERVRRHVLADGRPRSTEVANHGSVTLHQGAWHVRLEPGLEARPPKLTKRQAGDLLLIAHNSSARLVHEKDKGAAVHTGMDRIPPRATETLIEHGWIVTDGTDGAAVVVSLAGLIALEWRELRSLGGSAAHLGEEIAEALVDVFSS